MKKWKTSLLLALILSVIPLFSALGWTGSVNVSSLNMRKTASSKAKVIKVLKKNDSVSVLSTTGDWYKIKASGTSGYVVKKYISKGSSASSSSSSSSSGSGTCSVGDKGNSVKTVQELLKKLGYYSGSVDGDYGNGTKKAVIAFQKANGLKQTGNVNSTTLKKLKNGGSSSKSSSSSSSPSSSGKEGDPCSPGDKGAAVRWVQKKLKALGYLSDVDGSYGNDTKNAVKNFQKKNGLTDNGIANSKTISKLKSSKAVKASSGGGGGGSTTESLNWFKHPDRIPHHATFQVKDIKTGKVFKVKRWTGVNHADCEPASASDTKIMKSIYGSWSWKRRAILVKYNGHVYAASMNGMPHGTQTIKNNNFAGHFCIHFTGSKTHESKKVDSAHQSCVKTALKHSW